MSPCVRSFLSCVAFKEAEVLASYIFPKLVILPHLESLLMWCGG